jgi:DNA repair photolyase
MKNYNGKAIYSPKNKAAEYAEYACNFYVGCSNQCTYCFLRKGIGKATLGGNKPTLKKCFKNETHALDVFRKEALDNANELRKHGLFFSFTTDPMLPETIDLTFNAINTLITNGIPVKILTKRADWVNAFLSDNGILVDNKKAVKCHNVSFGFTLTGHDELEPNASTNAERMDAMEKLYNAGFKVWASIEPIINLDASLNMIYKTEDVCHLFKIGLLSGKHYSKQELKKFITCVVSNQSPSQRTKFYFKDSLLKQAGILRKDLPGNCVDRGYNIFNNK